MPPKKDNKSIINLPDGLYISFIQMQSKNPH